MGHSVPEVISRTITALGLRRPRPAWTVDGPGPLLKAEIDPVLLPATLLPYGAPCDEWVIEQFRRVDRKSAREQLDASFENLVLMSGARSRLRAPDAQRMHVQLGAPIIGSDRWFIRVRLSNYHQSGRGPPSLVDDDRYAWFDLEGRPLAVAASPEGSGWRPF